MSKVKDWSFKVKLGLMIGAFLVGIFVFATLAFTTLYRVEIGSERYRLIFTDKDIIGDYTPASLALNDTKRTLLEMEDTTDAATTQALVSRFRQQEQAFKDKHEYYDARAFNPALKAALDGDSYTTGLRFFEQVDSGYLPLIQSGQVPQAKDFRKAQLDPLFDKQTAAVKDAIETTNQLIASREKDAQSTVTSETIFMVITLLLVAVAVTLLGITMARTITHEIARLKSALKSLSEGDLTTQVDDCSQDEIGQIGLSLNETVQSMRSMVYTISSHAESIASAGEQLSASATQVAQSAETQKDQTTQVATAMQQMSGAVIEVSQSSSKTAAEAHAAEDLAVGGGEIVKQTVEVIKSMATSTRETAQRIEHLGKASDEIGRIIGVIQEIADQTNLLALNAAIEAARAGEQGRGFAVVAGEVRRLAERTSSATKEIENMIATIQSDTSRAVEAMRGEMHQVDEGVNTANRAGESLQQIIESSKGMQKMVTQIASASTEQAAATEQVNGNMEQIASMVQQSAVAANESARACGELSKLAFDLQKVVGQFKVHDERNRNRQLPNVQWQRALVGQQG